MNEDWDVLEVPTNCTVTYHIREGIFWGFDHTVTRFDKVPAWIRVHNGQWAVVTRSNCISH